MLASSLFGEGGGGDVENISLRRYIGTKHKFPIQVRLLFINS